MNLILDEKQYHLVQNEMLSPEKLIIMQQFKIACASRFKSNQKSI